MTSPKFVRYNANYYNNDIHDCVIRAISLGTNIGYTTICQCFKKEFKPGFGMLSDGISKPEVDEFIKKTHFIEEVDRDTRYVNWITGKTDKLDIHYGLPLELYIETLEGGKYVISTRKATMDRKDANEDLHMVFVDGDTKKFYDTWDSSGQLVYCVYKIKTRVGDSNKFSIKNDKLNLIKKHKEEKEGKGKTETVKENDKEHPECHVAIYVNEMGDNMFFSKILSREKKVETRPLSVWKRMKKLMGDDYIGQAVLLIGNKKIVGYGILQEVIEYKDKEDFMAHYDDHLVSDESMWKDDNPRVGLRFASVKKLDKPIPVNNVYPQKGTKQQGYISTEDFILQIELT